MGNGKRSARRLTPEEIRARRAQDALVVKRARSAAEEVTRSTAAAPQVTDDDLVEPGARPAATSAAPTDESEHEEIRVRPELIVLDESADHSGDLFVFVTRDGGVDEEERRAALQAMQPEGPASEVAAVKEVVIGLIERIPYVSAVSDRALMTIGTAFARWCLHNTADEEFTPERDLTEFAVEDFLNFAKHEVSEQTRGTYASQLRRLGGSTVTPRRGGSRKGAAAPYPARGRDRMWQAACAMDGWAAAEMRTLLALTFGAGCRGVEVHAAKAENVQRAGTRVVLTVVKPGGWVREIPVYGHYGRWLEQRSRELQPNEHLFRPTYNNRTNATSDLVTTICKTTDLFNGFKSTRARHSWLSQQLQAGIPFHAVCETAGIGRDSNLPTDLLPYMQQLTSIETRRHFDRVYSRIQEAS